MLNQLIESHFVKKAVTTIPTYFLYGEAPRQIDDRMLHVETIEARSVKHHWKIDPHIHHAIHQLIFVTFGRGVVLAETVRSQYRPPALAVVPAGSVHGFEFEPGTRGHVVSISNDLIMEIAQRERGVSALFKQPLTLELSSKMQRSSGLVESFKMLAQEFQRSGPGHALALEGWIAAILGNAVRLAHDELNSIDDITSQKRHLVARFSDLIENRFRQSLSLGEYVATLNVSESRLRNACLETTGQSPNQLIHARILLEAKRQLLYTSNSVSEVAYALGFDDPAYFTRFFSRRTGVSPRDFRSAGLQ
jgi:AraC family transcriptional regulator, transcriptional activator of pobA